jgi:NAD+--dinitrogen-reductase ADP-D-ribosyltransferase
MDEHKGQKVFAATLPTWARLPVNRCNLPPQILGSLTFQQHPADLFIDGVQSLYGTFFAQLEQVASASDRAAAFKAVMQASFFLDRPEEIGLEKGRSRLRREKADYLRILRGWLFDPDGREAAVLKGWVESRFGLLPRSHGGPLGDFDSENYQVYLTDRSRGLYNTNALEAQLDLLFTYCQYELKRRYPQRHHLTLFRGINRIDEHEVLAQPSKKTWILVLNNLNSFTSVAARADEFGDCILKVQVPLAKVLYMPDLLPATLKGEQEYLVIGGVYRVDRHTDYIR